MYLFRLEGMAARDAVLLRHPAGALDGDPLVLGVDCKAVSGILVHAVRERPRRVVEVCSFPVLEFL